MYNEIISKRFETLKNAGMITGANAVGHVGSVGAGDMIRLYMQIDNGVIKDAKFKTFGSVYSLAASDVLCDMLKNCNIQDALQIKGEDIMNSLGGFPDNKKHIADLIQSVIANAIDDYHKRLERLMAKAEKAKGEKK